MASWTIKYSKSTQLVATTVRVLNYTTGQRKNGNIIPRQCWNFFTDTRPICIYKIQNMKPSAGHQPILTKGFEVLWKFYLVYSHSTTNAYFKHLMKYQDHGIKTLIYTTIVANRASCVANTPIGSFTLLSLPQFCSLRTEDNKVEWSAIHLTSTVPLIISFLMML